jgi:serine/threonine protein kinase
MAKKPDVLKPDSCFGDFLLEDLIGEGGMGRVYRARQISLDRTVALKTLSFSEDVAGVRERFIGEARSAARLVHPNIVQIYAFGEYQNALYYVMEYVKGIDLDELLRMPSLPLPQNEIIKIIRSAAKALCIASAHDIVHRDIKPANIMISDDGQVKVMDFGLAKRISDFTLTQPGLIVGTPAYMSPEQIMGKPVDTRSDIYSLGCVLYQCLCAAPPFAAESLTSLLYKHIKESPKLSQRLLSNIQPELCEICQKMLEKPPGMRYQTATELIEALEKLRYDSAAAERTLALRATNLLAEQQNKAIGMNVNKATRTRATKRTTVQKAVLVRTSPLKGKSDNLSTQKSHSRRKRKFDNFYWGPLTQLGLFRKIPDGRWSYNEELARCPFAEGLATELILPPGQKAASIGDCLLCSNWNKRLGCAEAYCRELKTRKRFEGLELAVECALAWTGAGKFEKAIPIMEEYIKDNPADCAGYRELARIYEHPEYKGRDRRRAIVLYQRFIQLARETGAVPDYDIIRIEDRIKTLLTQNSTASGYYTATPRQIVFQCFYIGRSNCYVFGALSSEQLALVRAGSVDPASGLCADGLGSALHRVTTLFRHFKSECSTRDARQNTKTELERLTAVPSDQLVNQPNVSLVLPLEKVISVDMQFSPESEMNCLVIKSAADIHRCIFTQAWNAKAEQCHELLRRRILLKASCSKTAPASAHA